MLTITLQIGNQVLDVPSGFQFSEDLKHFNLSNLIHCAALDPSLQHDSAPLEIIHFTDFGRLHRKLILYPSKTEITLPRDVERLRLSIISPVTVPLPLSLNPILTSSEDEAFTQLFFLPPFKEKVEDLIHLDSSGASTKWNVLQGRLMEILETNSLGSYGACIGIIKEANVLPVMEPMKKFFESGDSFKQGSKVNIIVVSVFKELTFHSYGRFVSVHGLPCIPKDIVLKIAAGKNSFNTNERRTINICLNGGIPIQLLDNLNVQYLDNRPLRSEHFDRVEIHTGCFEKEAKDAHDTDILKKLESFVEDLKDHLHLKSSEAALRFIFWDPVLNRVFQHKSEGADKNYRLEPEWMTNCLFNHLKSQKVDLAITCELIENLFLPILLMEAGKERFDLMNPHKDRSKLLAIVSQAVIEQAYELIKQGKKPELARVCGLWIGGTTFQFIVAHAVVTELPDNTFEIHANININPHWFYDLSEPVVPKDGCTDVCCVPYQSGLQPELDLKLFETFKKGEMKMQDYIFYSGPTTTNTSFDEPETAESRNVPPVVAEARPSLTPLPLSSFSTPKGKKLELDPSQNGLKIINYVAQYVKATIDLLKSDESKATDEEKSRKFREKGIYGVLFGSCPSNTSESPDKTGRANASRQIPKSPTIPKSKSKKKSKMRTIILRKDSLRELKILQKLALFPRQFPVIHDWEIIKDEGTDDDVVVEYEMEELEDLVDPRYRIFNPRIRPEDPSAAFFTALNFSLDCLYALHLLHENFGIVHSDISLGNIMYSPVEGSWKLIDFDQSMAVEESEGTWRKAGTDDFIAPEACSTGIFGKASDVFSLGKVLYVLFYGQILQKVCVQFYEEPLPKELTRMGHQFVNFVLESMTNSDPKLRPTVLEAIVKIAGMLDYFEDFAENPIYSSVKMLVNEKHHMDRMKVEKDPVAVVASVAEPSQSPFTASGIDPKRNHQTQ